MPGEQGKTVAHGLILRETETKETDKILTVLTAEMGKIPVIARGARRKNSRLAAACQLFAWSEMTLYKRGNWYYLDSADPEELFAGLQKDLVRFALAAYLAELTEFVTGEEKPAGAQKRRTGGRPGAAAAAAQRAVRFGKTKQRPGAGEAGVYLPAAGPGWL